MISDHNPFSNYLTDKMMYDWTFDMSAEYYEEYSLQRYKELFVFFVSCFNNNKIELLEHDLLNETWEYDYGKTIGCKVFHLAVNCYLYYIGYRENQEIVNNEKKGIAKQLLKKVLSQNTKYLMRLYSSNIKETYLQMFLQNSELMQKNKIVKTLILTDIVRDFFTFSLLISTCYSIINLSELIKHNVNLSYYTVYITKEKRKRELFKDFVNIFCNDKRINSEPLYDNLKIQLQRYFTETQLKDSEIKLRKYKSQFSEEVLGNEYIKQIKEFLKNSFSSFNSKKGQEIIISNIVLLEQQYMVDFVDKELSQLSLDSLLFNLVLKIMNCLKKNNKIITKNHFHIKNTKEYLDFLSKNSLNFLIGSQDVITPYDYTNSNLLDKYEKYLSHLYILGWFRNILALKTDSLSISFNNFKFKFSMTTLEEMSDTFIKEENHYKSIDNTICFTKEEFNTYISNRYRKIIISADICLCVGDNAGYLLIPEKE